MSLVTSTLTPTFENQNQVRDDVEVIPTEMEMAVVPSCDLVAVRHKAVLKHAQSRRWREVWCDPANAKRLDCVRFIAAVSRPHPILADVEPVRPARRKKASSHSQPFNSLKSLRLA